MRLLGKNGQDQIMDRFTGKTAGYDDSLYKEEALYACPTCGLKVDIAMTVCPRDGSVIADYSSTERLLDNRYEVLSLVASGGMGSIYKARQPALNKIVAIKMLRVQSRDDGSWARFQQEAKAASHLAHRNIIKVYDFGQTADGQPYMVMDFVEGVNLQNLIKDETALTIEESLNIFKQICAGMAHAHEHHVYHRDLKPSNIMLSSLDSINPLVRIVDFGIAKVLDSQSEEQNLTHTGEVFGSPLYMSPEQALGKKVDARSDIYSVGCIMHETLTGSVPLSGASPFETFTKHLHDKPPSLREAKPLGIFSDELVALVSKSLAKDPLNRFQTMQELSSAIKSLPESIAIDQRKKSNPSFTGGATTAISIRDLPSPPKSEPSILIGLTEKQKLLSLTLLIAIIIAVGFVYLKIDTVNKQKLHRVNSFFHLAKQEIPPPPAIAEPKPAKPAGPISDEPPAPTDMVKLKESLTTKENTGGATKSESIEPDPLTDQEQQDTNSTIIELKNNASDANLRASAKQNPQAKTVILTGKFISDDGVQILSALPLQRLVLEDTQLSDKGFAVLAQLPNLEVLNLRQNTNLDDKSLLPLKKMTKLRILDLSKCPNISDLSMSHLPHSLQELSIQGDFHVTEKGYADVCKLSELKSLDTSSSTFTDEEAKLLPQLTKLQKLIIGDTCLSDHSMPIFKKLPLTELFLEKTMITKKGLMQLTEMPFITRIATQGCPYLSKEDREDFRNKGKKVIQLEPRD